MSREDLTNSVVMHSGDFDQYLNGEAYPSILREQPTPVNSPTDRTAHDVDPRMLYQKIMRENPCFLNNCADLKDLLLEAMSKPTDDGEKQEPPKEG